VARALVIENLVLALLAAGAGLLLGDLALRTLGTFDLQDLPYGAEIRLDVTAALWALLISLAIGLVMGLLPVATLLPAGLTAVLREESDIHGRARRAALRRAMVVARVAFTFVLLLGAGLLLAIRKVLRVDPGFVAGAVTTASVLLPRTRYADDDRRAALPTGAPANPRAPRRERQCDDSIPSAATATASFRRGLSDAARRVVISPNAVDVTPGYFGPWA
jgi:hypothetical protein